MAKTWDDVGPPPDRVRFTVYRSTWARGGMPGTRLLSDGGMRCCLGHLARDLGLPDAACLGRTYFPKQRYDENYEPVPDPAIGRYLRIAKSGGFVSVNDDTGMSDLEREALLTEMFADAGADVSFVDTEG